MTMARYALHAAADRLHGSQYLRHIVRAVELADDGPPRNLRPEDPYQDDTARPYAGLAITAQADRNPEPTAEGLAYSYAWRVGIASDDPVILQNAAALVSTLRTVDRALARDRERYGMPPTFGAYVARIASALRLPIVAGESGPDGTYAGGEWREWTPGDAVDLVDGWTRAFRR
jgi:hypothetical protein